MRILRDVEDIAICIIKAYEDDENKRKAKR